MPSLTARDRAERDAMQHYLTDDGFRKYVNDGCDDGAGVCVELSTHLVNYYGID